MWIYVIVGSLILLSILGILFIHVYNQFQFAMIKIDEAENNMDSLLRKKQDLLLRLLPFITEKDEQEAKQIIEIEKLKDKALNNFELHRTLITSLHEIRLMLDHQEDLSENDSFYQLKLELVDIEEEIDASVHYYNDNVVKYNKLIKCFPSNIVKFVFHYKAKDFYSNEKEELYEILKK